MPIDRTVRDAQLAALVAFMRREITSGEFDRRIRPSRSEDRSAGRVYWMLWTGYDDFVDHTIHACADRWNRFRRLAAFLKTDLELETVRRRVWSRRQLYALVGLLVLAAGLLASRRAGSWLPLVAAWAGTAAVWTTWRPGRAIPAEVAALWRFSPFRDEAQWQRYEPLLSQIDLPPYDPRVHHQPVGDPDRRRRVVWASRLLGGLMIPLVLLVHLVPTTYVFCVARSEADSCAPSRESQAQADAPGEAKRLS